MENSKINHFMNSIKRIFSSKQTQFTLYMAMVLWLAVVTQMVVNRVFREDFQITEAFVNTDMEEMKSSLEIVAEYSGEFLSETDKKNMIHQIADSVGLTLDKDISIRKEGSRSEYAYTKQAKYAETEIKVISMEQEYEEAIRMKHYIIVRMSILQSIQSIEGYKNKLLDVLGQLGVDQKQIAELLVNELHGEIALDYEEGGLYTVYAYTGLINEYIVSLGSKVNIQVAITYDEGNDKTIVTLATPILNESW